MALFSKIFPEAVNVTCRTMVHQQTDSCCLAAGDMALASGFGSARFFAFIYLANFLIKLSKDKNKALAMFSRETLKSYLRSVTYGMSSGIIFITSNCFIRWLLGRYTDLSACFCSASLAGISLLFDASERRPMVITSYGSLAIDCLLRRLKELNILSLSKNQQTITFMMLNAVLMYLLKYHNQKAFWIFNPACRPREDGKGTKYTDDGRVKELQKTFLKYFGTGIAVQAARLIFSDFSYLRNPFLLILELLKLSNMKLGAFLGLYVIGYQILLHLLQQNKKVGNFPFDVALYCMYNGFLYHMRAMNGSAVPKSFIRIMSLVTNKRSDYIYKYYENIPKK